MPQRESRYRHDKWIQLTCSVPNRRQNTPRPAVAEAGAVVLVPKASSGSSRLTEDEGVMGKPREATSEACGSSPSGEVPSAATLAEVAPGPESGLALEEDWIAETKTPGLEKAFITASFIEL